MICVWPPGVTACGMTVVAVWRSHMRRSPLARVSPKRRDEAHEYDRARTLAFLRDRGVCQAARTWTDIDCAGSRVDTHHIRPRSRGGAYADPENLVCVCRAHHNAIHAWPIKAKELGLLQ